MKCSIDSSKKFEIGYVLGAIKGDGFIGKHTERQRMIMLSVANKTFCETFRNCLLKICGHKYKVCKVKNYRYSQGYCWVVRCTIKSVVDFFEKYDIYTLLNREDDIKIGFLRGFFDAEGCSFCKYYPDRQSFAKVVMICNKNKKLLELCQNLLESLELKTRKISNRTVKGDVYPLHLSISKENLTRFKERVGFSIPYKNLNVEECLNTYVR
jgi:intein-encoded DNA endonuclease-like protein